MLQTAGVKEHRACRCEGATQHLKDLAPLLEELMGLGAGRRILLRSVRPDPVKG